MIGHQFSITCDFTSSRTNKSTSNKTPKFPLNFFPVSVTELCASIRNNKEKKRGRIRFGSFCLSSSMCCSSHRYIVCLSFFVSLTHTHATCMHVFIMINHTALPDLLNSGVGNEIPFNGFTFKEYSY